MTRGALTAFLIANDVAKCFAPAACDVGARSATADNGSLFRLNAPRARKEFLCGRSQEFTLGDKGTSHE